MRTINILPLALLLFSACATIDRTATRELATYGAPFDAAWHDTINKQNKKVLNSWRDFTDPEDYKDWPDRMVYTMNLTEDDIKKNKLTNVQSEIYLITPEALRAWNPNEPFEPIMELQKDCLYNLVAKDDTFFSIGGAILLNSKWEVVAGGELRRAEAKSLSDVYFNKKKPILSVSIGRKEESFMRLVFFTFKENGTYYCFLMDKKRTLKDVLIEFKPHSTSK
jgi:hypothetical protein